MIGMNITVNHPRTSLFLIFNVDKIGRLISFMSVINIIDNV